MTCPGFTECSLFFPVARRPAEPIQPSLFDILIGNRKRDGFQRASRLLSTQISPGEASTIRVAGLHQFENLFPNWHFRVISVNYLDVAQTGSREFHSVAGDPNEATGFLDLSAIPDGLFHPDKGWLGGTVRTRTGKLQEQALAESLFNIGALPAELFFEEHLLYRSRFFDDVLCFPRGLLEGLRLNWLWSPGDCPMSREGDLGCGSPEYPAVHDFPRTRV